MFSVGQKVICINDNFSNLTDPRTEMRYPKFGVTYTVRQVTIFGIALKEVVNRKYIFIKHGNMLSEPYFNENRFISIEDSGVDTLEFISKKVL